MSEQEDDTLISWLICYKCQLSIDNCVFLLYLLLSLFCLVIWASMSHSLYKFAR